MLHSMSDYLPSYRQIEELCRYAWRLSVIDLVTCELNSNYSIRTMKKWDTVYLLLPCGKTQNQHSRFKEARELIVDVQITADFENQGIINWTRSTKSVKPLIVAGDGNSLCHAVSVLIWGIPDQILFFRRLLKDALVRHADYDSPLYIRWITYTRSRCAQLGKNCTKEEMEREWNKLRHSASASSVGSRLSSRSSPSSFSPLSQFHIFVLANICRRVIVVVGKEEKSFQPSVYIPLLLPDSKCVKCPLYLAFHEGHFAPLAFIDEVETDTRFRDLCFPLVDKQFRPFVFPFLFDNENGLEILEQYDRLTVIGFMTATEFKEVPALRVPEKAITSRSRSTGSDPSGFISVCFDVLNHGGLPSDVFNNWRFVLGMQKKFEEELPVGHTFDNAAQQPTSIPYQPECDNDEEEEEENEPNTDRINSEVKDSGYGGSMPTTQRTSEANDLESEGNNWEVENNPGASCEDQAVSEMTAVEDDNDSSIMSSVSNSRISPLHVYIDEISNHSITPESHANLDDMGLTDVTGLNMGENVNVQTHVTESMDEIETDYFKHQSEEIDHTTSSRKHRVVTSPLPSRQPTRSSEELAGARSLVTRSLSNGSILLMISENHIQITNCGNISLTEMLIKSGLKKIHFRLESAGLDSDNKVRLLFPNHRELRHVNIECKFTSKDELELKLTAQGGSWFQLLILFPSSVILEPERSTNFTEAIPAYVDGAEGIYVDVQDHPEKCRTAGCQGRAIAQYRNLCSSCFQSWQELLQRRPEASATFNFFDSVSDSQNNSNDGRCKNPSCSNKSEQGCYGFCKKCYNAPGI